jgi:hypothetical protein
MKYKYVTSWAHHTHTQHHRRFCSPSSYTGTSLSSTPPLTVHTKRPFSSDGSFMDRFISWMSEGSTQHIFWVHAAHILGPRPGNAHVLAEALVMSCAEQVHKKIPQLNAQHAEAQKRMSTTRRIQARDPNFGRHCGIKEEPKMIGLVPDCLVSSCPAAFCSLFLSPHQPTSTTVPLKTPQYESNCARPRTCATHL